MNHITSEPFSIFYFNHKNNFGDCINIKFWEYMTGYRVGTNTLGNHFLTTGSILQLTNNKSIVIGAGFISDDAKLQQAPKCILAVRGPLTRAKVLAQGYRCPAVYGDPLVLMPAMYPKQTQIEEKIVGIIPHYVDKQRENVLTLKESLEDNGYKVYLIDIQVGDDYKRLIHNINRCSHIISSSLHGVIMGLAYKKKTVFLPFSDRVIGNNFKFNDFFASVKINYRMPPADCFDTSVLNYCIKLDYRNLIQTGLNILEASYFINNIRKKSIRKQYLEFYGYVED